ncbi:hypothetical protein WMF30_08075 [Sorangium sp. So ce134]
MAQLADVYCWIKVIEEQSGKVVPSGAQVEIPRKAIVRYVVANDSNKPAGPLTIVGALRRDGVVVQPNGQPNVVPAQQITLQPGQIWKFEYLVTESSISAKYTASILADVGNFVKEEDERNNKFTTAFEMVDSPE